MARVADCHPDRKHLAKGLCRPCYWRMRYADPAFSAKRKAYNKAYYREFFTNGAR